MLFDTLHTLPHEIEFVWRAKFSLPAALYITGRYANIFSVLTDLISNNIAFDNEEVGILSLSSCL